MGNTMNPTHPTHYALTAAQGVRRGEERRESVEKVHSAGAEGTRERRVLKVGKTIAGECNGDLLHNAMTQSSSSESERKPRLSK